MLWRCKIFFRIKKTVTDPDNQYRVNLYYYVQNISLNNSDAVRIINSESYHSHSKNLNVKSDSSGTKFQHASRAWRFFGKQGPRILTDIPNVVFACLFITRFVLWMTLLWLRDMFCSLTACQWKTQIVPRSDDDTENCSTAILLRGNLAEGLFDEKCQLRLRHFLIEFCAGSVSLKTNDMGALSTMLG